MRSALEAKRPWTGEGNLAAIERDRRLPGDGYDLAVGEHIDADLAARRGDRVVGQYFQRIVVRLQAECAVGSDALEAAVVGVQAGGATGDIAVGGAGGVWASPWTVMWVLPPA